MPHGDKIVSSVAAKRERAPGGTPTAATYSRVSFPQSSGEGVWQDRLTHIYLEQQRTVGYSQHRGSNCINSGCVTWYYSLPGRYASRVSPLRVAVRIQGIGRVQERTQQHSLQQLFQVSASGRLAPMQCSFIVGRRHDGDPTIVPLRTVGAKPRRTIASGVYRTIAASTTAIVLL